MRRLLLRTLMQVLILAVSFSVVFVVLSLLIHGYVKWW